MAGHFFIDSSQSLAVEWGAAINSRSYLEGHLFAALFSPFSEQEGAEGVNPQMGGFGSWGGDIFSFPILKIIVPFLPPTVGGDFVPK